MMCTKGERRTSRLHRAYVSLVAGAEGGDGSRVVSLARCGTFELRLVEFSDRRTVDAPLFWIELFRHDTRTLLDRCPCDDLEHAETIAEHLMSRARKMNRSPPQS